MNPRRLRLHNAIERLKRRWLIACRTVTDPTAPARAERLKARIITLTHAYIKTPEE